ncbi:extracellular solute-binding protein [Bdellovibrio sp. HCB337]|uniref:extracellular solute-binding protein n=1 Tax=Bdellovibrio sp. HCB337 TaxID=3394358 RepID=UPI0039A5F166
MKNFIFLSAFLGAIQFASAQNTVVKWVGQFPAEQAAPAVDLFNAEHAAELGFTVEYKYDETVVADLLAGKAHPEYDLVHMKDAEMLNSLAKKSLSTPIALDNKAVLPAHLKDANNNWIAVLKRARIIYYNSDLVADGEVKNYEDLSDAKFKDKLCLRQKKAQYNLGLYAFFLDVLGTEKTTSLLKAWADNTAGVPLLEKDLDEVIVKVAKGECAVGVANTYYYMRHLRATPDSKVKAVIPNQNDIGAHVNIDGVALLKDATQLDNAQIFANWLLTEKAQLALSKITDKFPANPAVTSAPVVQAFGPFKENQSFNLNRITELKDEALKIATEQGLK